MENNENTQNSVAKPYKRRTIFIKKKLQFKYMALIVLSVLTGFIVVSFEIMLNLTRLFSDRPALLAPLLNEINQIIPTFIVEMAIYLAVVLIIAVIVSHKLAGPVYKFEKSAALVAKGDLTYRVFLRKGDNLEGLQKEFNDMVSGIHKGVQGDSKIALDAAEKLKNIADKITDENIKRQLNEQIESLKQIGKEFKL